MIKEKILALIPKKQEQEVESKEIKVLDLKQYLVNGYEEIRQVKQKNIELKDKLEEESKNKQLYEGALVTLSEFQKRDEENKKEITKLENKLEKKQKEIENLNSTLNTYKINEYEFNKRKSELENEIEKVVKKTINLYKENLIQEIENTKGNLSKSKIVNIVEALKIL